MFIEQAYMNVILEKQKVSNPSFFEIIKSAGNVEFNYKGFEKKWPKIEKELKEVDDQMKPD